MSEQVESSEKEALWIPCLLRRSKMEPGESDGGGQ
jgi:hypothetical protein